MFVLANLLTALAHVLRVVIYTFNIILIVRVVVSWLPPQQLYRYRGFVVVVERATEWLLAPLRRRLKLVQGGFDLSPLVAMLLLYFVDLFLVKTLFMLAARMAL